MALRLPPLSTLRSFECAARLLSFSKAAEELHVTHGAVSRAIRQLEDFLGQRLFVRATRAVKLTPAGTAYAASVREVLERLSTATARVMNSGEAGPLGVSTLDSFAAKWLVPRLFRFRQRHPDVDVRLSTTDRLADFVTDGIDVAIRFGRGRYSDLAADLLMQEDVYPVCSPKLLDGEHPLREPAQLRFHTLIHDEFRIDWTMWLRIAGVEGVDPRRGPYFQSSDLAVQAAIQGEGVVLGRSSLVEDDLKAGRLVRPFELSLPSDVAYYLVYPPRALDLPKVRAFREWMLEEAGQMQRGNGRPVGRAITSTADAKVQPLRKAGGRRA